MDNLKALKKQVADVLARFDDLAKQNRLFVLVEFFKENWDFVKEKMAAGFSLAFIFDTLKLGGVFKSYDYAEFKSAFDAVKKERQKAINKEKYAAKKAKKSTVNAEKSTPAPVENKPLAVEKSTSTPAPAPAKNEPAAVVGDEKKKVLKNGSGFNSSALETFRKSTKAQKVKYIIEDCEILAEKLPADLRELLEKSLFKFADSDLDSAFENLENRACNASIFKENLLSILQNLDNARQARSLIPEDCGAFMRSILLGEWLEARIWQKVCKGHAVLSDFCERAAHKKEKSVLIFFK